MYSKKCKYFENVKKIFSKDKCITLYTNLSQNKVKITVEITVKYKYNKNILAEIIRNIRV